MSKEQCKKAYETNQLCSHIPDKIKVRLFNMEKFTKYDTGKPKHSLLPPKTLDGVLDVMAFGAAKYEKDNWKKCDTPSSYYDACHRHLEEFWSGIDNDAESGLHHLDHAMCNLIFLKWILKNKPETDTRLEEQNGSDKQIQQVNKKRITSKGVSIFDRGRAILRNCRSRG